MILRLGMLIALFYFFGCAKSEALDTEELDYVHLTVALAKAKAFAHDSVAYNHLRDSVFRVFHTTKDAYTVRTESMTNKPERTSIIFRAISDSLGIR